MRLLLILLVLQTPAPQLLNWAADDGRRVEELHARGTRVDGTHVIVWLPPGILTDAEHRALVKQLDTGVAELRRLIGRHTWQIVGDERLTYYISTDQFVAHATGRAAIFVPVVRLKEGRAPFFHEAAHELLARQTVGSLTPEQRATHPLWLIEGLPDYLAQTVATRTGLPEGDVFQTGGLDGVDATCAARLSTPAGDEVMKYIGAPGSPRALFTTERQVVAPTFYACSFSFTKFLIQRIGLPETVALLPRTADGTLYSRIEELAGKPMAALRDEWRTGLPRR